MEVHLSFGHGGSKSLGSFLWQFGLGSIPLFYLGPSYLANSPIANCLFYHVFFICPNKEAFLGFSQIFLSLHFFPPRSGKVVKTFKCKHLRCHFGFHGLYFLQVL